MKEMKERKGQGWSWLMGEGVILPEFIRKAKGGKWETTGKPF